MNHHPRSVRQVTDWARRRTLRVRKSIGWAWRRLATNASGAEVAPLRHPQTDCAESRTGRFFLRCPRYALCCPFERARHTSKAAGSKKWEPADKPGSVVGSHSSRPCVAAGLKHPTRERRGPRHSSPIWSCSRWGLPCRSVARLAVRSYRTVSPLQIHLRPPPDTEGTWSAACAAASARTCDGRAQMAIGGLLSVALSVGLRRPGVTWHLALWSPDFPRHAMRDAAAWPAPA